MFDVDTLLGQHLPRLAFMGLPCPNLFTGGHNFHGKHEFIPLQSMEKAVATLVALVQLTSAWREQ